MAYTCNTQAHGLSLEYITGKPAGFTGQYIVLDNKLLLADRRIGGSADRRIGKPLDYYKRAMYCPFLNHLLSEFDSCTILRPQLLKRFLTVTHKSSQIYPGHL